MSMGSKPPRQMPAQPWQSSQTDRPNPWMEPFLQGGMGLAGDILNDRLQGGGGPPTFGDYMSGGVQSSFSPAGGMGPIDFGVGDGGPRPPGGLGPRGGPEGLPRPEFMSGGGGDQPGLPPGLGPPLGAGRPPPRGGGVGGGPGTGAGGGLGALRQQLAQQMVNRGPSPGLGAGMDFITNMLADPGGTPGGIMAQQTYDDTRNPNAPINQLISREMEFGNPASGMQEDFISQLFGRFNAPQQAPGPVAPRYDLMAQFGGGEPLFEFGGF